MWVGPFLELVVGVRALGTRGTPAGPLWTPVGRPDGASRNRIRTHARGLELPGIGASRVLARRRARAVLAGGRRVRTATGAERGECGAWSEVVTSRPRRGWASRAPMRHLGGASERQRSPRRARR